VDQNTYPFKINNHFKDQLIDFIKSICKSPDDCKEKWKGKRCMIDLCELVKRFYYDPLTKGSNSIKQVFPAILKRSEFLKNKYGKPIYGVARISPKNVTDSKSVRSHGNII
jgi:hypothetical protein